METTDPAARERRTGWNLVKLLRPHQWAKNAFVVAPLLFAREAHDPAQLVRALAAVVFFSLAASAVYCVNDVLDAPRDRMHPTKRLRPVAAGLISPGIAKALGLVLAVLALAGGTVLSPAFARILGVYLALNLLYTMRLKHVVLLDVLIISISFVLRVLGGAAAINVPASHWLLLCTLLLALYLAFAKRRAELRMLGSGSADHRPALVGYTPELLDRFGSILLGATIVAYALYTVSPETIAKFGSDRLIYGLPFVIYGLFRYLLLVEAGGDAGEPGTLALRDAPLLICVVLWIAFNAAMIYAR
ncbi:MAG: decaprenyl-phosphate phosphoribosyltransferase [Thermoanaerobaculia bacterium]